MPTRLDLFRKMAVTKSSDIDAVFLRNKAFSEMGGDQVMNEPYKKSDLVYICISTTGKAISQVPIVVVRVKSNGTEHMPLPSSDPWQILFSRPNYLTDRYSFVESIISFLLLDGLVYVIPFPPGLNPPNSLWVVRKKFIKPIKDQKTGHLLGYYYNPTGMIIESGGVPNQGTIPLAIDEVSRIFFFNPYDPLDGLSPLEAGRMNIVVDYKAQVYTSVFFDEGAQPGGVLSTEQKLGDKQFVRTKEQFESRHGGYKKAHRLAVLEQGLKYTQTGLSQKDMEFKDLRKLTSKRIFQVFGMKNAIVSETDDVNYATSREQRKEWWEGTNLPLMTMVSSALNFTLFSDRGDLKCIFDITTVAALKEALKEKVETGQKLWQMGFTADEINQRLDLGFTSKPWRKTWYIPVNLMPIEQINEPKEDEKPPKEPIEELQPYNPKLLGSGVDKNRGEQIWNGLINRISPLEELFSKKTSRVFFNMRKRSLELLYRVPKTPKDVEDDIYSNETKEMERFSDPLYKEALIIGVTSVIEESGTSIAFDLMDPEAISFLSNKNLKIRGVIQTIKDQIQEELVEAYEKGETIDQIADRIRGVFDVAKSRARTIARTEIVGAANEGRSIAINHSGFREKEWFTAGDEKVRDQHRAMHGTKIKVGQAWVFPDGTSVRHPGDYNGPAHQIINCRCVELVVPGTHYLNN